MNNVNVLVGFPNPFSLPHLQWSGGFLKLMVSDFQNVLNRRWHIGLKLSCNRNTVFEMIKIIKMHPNVYSVFG